MDDQILGENVMTQGQTLRLPEAFRWNFAGLGATIRAIVSGLAAEHTLAQRAAAAAALPRQKLTELRAMYTRSSD